MLSLLSLVMASIGVTSAVKIADMEQGAAFDKCISITDLETKTIDDDITLVDREDGGCCPDGTVPGVKYTTSYFGPQIVCGFKTDGSVQVSTGSSNGNKVCTYNSCYVLKQNVECADGRQFLNGCCAAPADCSGNACGFKASCKNYASSFNNVYSNKVNYCTTYDKDYGTKGWAGTSDKADDQADGKLQADKLYTYTQCAAGSTSGNEPETSGVTHAAAPATFFGAAMLLMTLGL
jgi:hypothetical protein